MMPVDNIFFFRIILFSAFHNIQRCLRVFCSCDQQSKDKGVAVNGQDLVTGGAGYIGSHVVKALGKKG